MQVSQAPDLLILFSRSWQTFDTTCDKTNQQHAWFQVDFDTSILSYLDCLTRNRPSIKSQTQTIWFKMRTLFPPLCNFCKRFSKIIFPEGLSSFYEFIGAHSVSEVVSPSATVPWIKYLISLVLAYVVHWQQHQIRCILHILGWVIVDCRNFWSPSLNLWGWENYQVWHPWIWRNCSFRILPYNKSFELV